MQVPKQLSTEINTSVKNDMKGKLLYTVYMSIPILFKENFNISSTQRRERQWKKKDIEPSAGSVPFFFFWTDSYKRISYNPYLYIFAID